MWGIKTSFLLVASISIKLLTGLIVSKIGAISLGVENYAITGLITNLISMVGLIAGGGVYIGLGKKLTNQGSNLKELEWINSATTIVLLFSILSIPFTLLICQITIDDYTNNLSYLEKIILIVAIALAAFPIGLSSVSTGILTGLNIPKTFYISIILGSLSGILIIILLSFIFEGFGYLVGAICLPITQSIILIFIARKYYGIYPLFKFDLNLNRANILLKYGSLALLAGVSIPLCSIMVRDLVVETSGVLVGGIYQGVLRLSESYMQLPMLLLGSYFYPKFCSYYNKPNFNKKILESYIILFGLMILIGIFLMITSPILVKLIFTEEFNDMLNYINLNWLGDTFKILSFLGATILTAMGKIKICLAGTVLHTVLYWGLSKYYIINLSLLGSMYGYIMAYGIYFIITLTAVYIMGRENNAK